MRRYAYMFLSMRAPAADPRSHLGEAEFATKLSELGAQGWRVVRFELEASCTGDYGAWLERVGGEAERL